MNTKLITFTRGALSITLIGVVHIGSQQYYDKIQEVLDGFVDSNVYFERVSGGGNSKYSKLIRLMSSKLDTIHQNEGLVYKEKWINADINIDVFENLKGDSLDNIMGVDDKIKLITRNSKLFITLFKFLITYPNIIRLFFRTDYVTIKFRNSIALNKIFNEIHKKKNVCLLYGDGHIKHLGDILRGVGFKVDNNESIEYTI